MEKTTYLISHNEDEEIGATHTDLDEESTMNFLMKTDAYLYSVAEWVEEKNIMQELREFGDTLTDKEKRDIDDYLADENNQETRVEARVVGIYHARGVATIQADCTFTHGQKVTVIL